MWDFFLIVFSLFVWFDIGIYYGTLRLIRDEWPLKVLIPGGAIYYKMFPPNKPINSD